MTQIPKKVFITAFVAIFILHSAPAMARNVKAPRNYFQEEDRFSSEKDQRRYSLEWINGSTVRISRNLPVPVFSPPAVNVPTPLQPVFAAADPEFLEALSIFASRRIYYERFEHLYEILLNEQPVKCVRQTLITLKI